MPTMPTKEDVHKELLRRAEEAVQTTRDGWAIAPASSFALTWAGEKLTGDDGKTINDVVFCDLPAGKDKQLKVIQSMVRKTRALAMLWVRCTTTRVIALFKGPCGGKIWVFPITEGGGLGEPMERVWD